MLYKGAFLLEPETSEDASTAESDAADKKVKLNPNATEFRPRVKRNTPSPVSYNFRQNVFWFIACIS